MSGWHQNSKKDLEKPNRRKSLLFWIVGIAKFSYLVNWHNRHFTDTRIRPYFNGFWFPAIVIFWGYNLPYFQPILKQRIGDQVNVCCAHTITKIEAILAYRSQISTFFTDRADLEQQVIGYANSIGGERIWKQLTMNKYLSSHIPYRN